MALGKAARGVALSFIRNAAIPICAGLFLCSIIGVRGVLFEGPLSGALTMILVIALMTHEWRDLEQKGRQVNAVAMVKPN